MGFVIEEELKPEKKQIHSYLFSSSPLHLIIYKSWLASFLKCKIDFYVLDNKQDWKISKFYMILFFINCIKSCCGQKKVVSSVPSHASNFSNPDCIENQQGTLSEGYIAVCNDHGLESVSIGMREHVKTQWWPSQSSGNERSSVNLS